MKLETRRWGPSNSDGVVCIHGIAQHGGIFEAMGERLAARGHFVVAVDLRGHGESGREPPWDVETHVQDLLETVDALEIERASWVAHSFGGRVAATIAAESTQRTQRLVLLDPGLQVAPGRALRSAEIERLDWSFATIDGAINALLSNDAVLAAPREVVAAYVEDDVRKGADGRFRFRFSPSAVVTAWSEITRPAPPVAQVPTLFVHTETTPFGGDPQVDRYRRELGELLTVTGVPNGHNVLWESPRETIAAVEGFLEPLRESAAG